MDTQARRLTMLNSPARREALENLEKSVDEHVEVRKNATDASAELLSQRRRATREVIGRVEACINTLANSPKEFDKTVDHYRVEAGRFERRVEQLEDERLGELAERMGLDAGTTGVHPSVGSRLRGPYGKTPGSAWSGTAPSAFDVTPRV